MRRWGLLASFGTVGDCYDNAAMDSFMQVELLNTRKWVTTVELATAIADYIDNFERRDHGGLAKALWTLFILFVPVIGVLAYIITRPRVPDLGISTR